jgi:predicted RNA-binding protein YlqC (UPF0109 family)
MLKFIEQYIKLLAFHPEDVKVGKGIESEEFIEIVVYAHKSDTGRIIGKSGNIIKALKTLISGCKAKDKTNYKISVVSNDEQR